MKDIAEKPRMQMKDCVAFTGFSRQNIARLIALSKAKLISPPFPFMDFTCSKKRHLYYFDKEAVSAWIDAMTFG